MNIKYKLIFYLLIIIAHHSFTFSQSIEEIYRENELESQTDALVDSIISIKYQVKTKSIYEHNDHGFVIFMCQQKNYNGIWEVSYRIDFKYNSANKLVEKTEEYFTDNELSSSNKEKISYNVDGNPDTIIHQTFKENEWKITSVETYCYSETGLKTSVTLKDVITDQLFNISKDSLTYDGQGNNTSFTFFIYKGNEWISNKNITYKYNEQNQHVQIIEERRRDDQLELFRLDSIIYNENNDILIQETKIWKDTIWEPLYRWSYIYNEFDLLTKFIKQQWWDGDLINREADIYEYDDKGNLILSAYEVWMNDEWERAFRSIYEYDEQNNLAHGIAEKFENNVWMPGQGGFNVTGINGYVYEGSGSEVFIYYNSVTDIAIGNPTKLETEFVLKQNYPNPFNPTTIISFQIPVTVKQHAVSLQVYDILGRKVSTLINKENISGYREVEFDAADLPSGIYFYKLTSGKFTSTKKMLLIK